MTEERQKRRGAAAEEPKRGAEKHQSREWNRDYVPRPPFALLRHDPSARRAGGHGAPTPPHIFGTPPSEGEFVIPIFEGSRVGLIRRRVYGLLRLSRRSRRWGRSLSRGRGIRRFLGRGIRWI